ncbi:DUF4307 domain-containing protein [Nocardia callitridis]|uniref:DUF4307 domain-containing protein n=1 Tax=Nocardia callitridis TaxID=648753 RepID=A0ABP9JU72_9NOCA
MSDPAPETAGDVHGAATTTASRQTDRYGAPPPVRRRWIAAALGVVVVVVGLAIAYVGYRNFGPKQIEPEQLGYTVVDDSTLTVNIKVTRADPQRPVVCLVRAMDRDSNEVGRREVLIEPSPTSTVQLTTTVRSTSRPSAGDIFACSEQVPDYLRAQ